MYEEKDIVGKYYNTRGYEESQLVDRSNTDRNYGKAAVNTAKRKKVATSAVSGEEKIEREITRFTREEKCILMDTLMLSLTLLKNAHSELHEL